MGCFGEFKPELVPQEEAVDDYYITIKQAVVLGLVSDPTIRDWIAAGRLKVTKRSGTIYISESSFDKRIKQYRERNARHIRMNPYDAHDTARLLRRFMPEETIETLIAILKEG